MRRDNKGEEEFDRWDRKRSWKTRKREQTTVCCDQRKRTFFLAVSYRSVMHNDRLIGCFFDDSRQFLLILCTWELFLYFPAQHHAIDNCTLNLLNQIQSCLFVGRNISFSDNLFNIPLHSATILTFVTTRYLYVQFIRSDLESFIYFG